MGDAAAIRVTRPLACRRARIRNSIKKTIPKQVLPKQVRQGRLRVLSISPALRSSHPLAPSRTPPNCICLPSISPCHHCCATCCQTQDLLPAAARVWAIAAEKSFCGPYGPKSFCGPYGPKSFCGPYGPKHFCGSLRPKCFCGPLRPKIHAILWAQWAEELSKIRPLGRLNSPGERPIGPRSEETLRGE